MENDITTKYDQYLEVMPEEVVDFMWSNQYDILILAIQKTLSLTDDQTKLAKMAGYELLMGVKNMLEKLEDFKTSGIPEELSLKILYLIDTEIITRAENITEFFSPEIETPEQIEIKAPSPDDILQRLKETITKPTIITPTKRDYSLEKTPESKSDSTKTIDPYREIPEK